MKINQVITMNQSIFSIKIQKIIAELEINSDFIRCTTNATVHFDIPLSNLRSYGLVKPNHILMNFYQNEELYQVTINSNHSVGILNVLDSRSK